jgi:hypothetical protein
MNILELKSFLSLCQPSPPTPICHRVYLTYIVIRCTLLLDASLRDLLTLRPVVSSSRADPNKTNRGAAPSECHHGISFHSSRRISFSLRLLRGATINALLVLVMTDTGNHRDFDGLCRFTGVGRVGRMVFSSIAERISVT